MDFIHIDNKNRRIANQFLMDHWYSTKMIVRGREYDLSIADGIIAMEQDQIKGMVTYIFYEDTCEIMSLDSLEPSKGIGTTMIHKVIEAAKKNHCKKLTLITTNDNMNAIRFYQKHGFDMIRLYRNALDITRKLKPEIPLIGDNGIPLRHEIEFEMAL